MLSYIFISLSCERESFNKTRMSSSSTVKKASFRFTLIFVKILIVKTPVLELSLDEQSNVHFTAFVSTGLVNIKQKLFTDHFQEAPEYRRLKVTSLTWL